MVILPKHLMGDVHAPLRGSHDQGLNVSQALLCGSYGSAQARHILFP
jgi:hypothetical protein